MELITLSNHYSKMQMYLKLALAMQLVGYYKEKDQETVDWGVRNTSSVNITFLGGYFVGVFINTFCIPFQYISQNT